MTTNAMTTNAMTTNAADRPTRLLAVYCPDWPVIALERPAELPVAVLRANRIVAAGHAARAQGVLPGLRRREAQARCPQLELHDYDPSRDARVFEKVLIAMEQIAPQLEITTPGRCAVPTIGPSRLHGGDRALAKVVLGRVNIALNELTVPTSGGARSTRAAAPGCVGVGIADGPRCAALAAEESVARTSGRKPLVIPPGASAEFLASLPVGWLDPDPASPLTATLVRLGLRTIGRFAALPPSDVLDRFGPQGLALHQVATGCESRQPVLANPPTDLSVLAEPDPPLERVDQAAFLVKVLAEEFLGQLAARALIADRVLVMVATADGEVLERSWRHEGELTPSAVAQRVRWQLDGWLASGRVPGGVIRIELHPQEVRSAEGVQLGLWGDHAVVRDRAVRGVARVQALVGADAVTVPEWQGGRTPAEQYRLVPFDLADPDHRPDPTDRPWPGQIPPPYPSVVWSPSKSAQVLDANGGLVGVGGRGRITAGPATCRIEHGPNSVVRSWAGPWCADERWWDPVRHRRRARLQVVLEPDGMAHLLMLEDGRWWVEASYQ